MNTTHNPERRLLRPAALLAALSALGLTFSLMVGPTLAADPYRVYLQEHQQGSDSSTFKEDEDCGDFTSGVVWHFILNQYSGGDTAHLVADFDSAGTLETDASTVLPSVQHFYLNTPTDDILLDAYAEVANEPGDANLVLSHVCHTGVEQTPTPTPSESEEASVEESIEESEEASIEESEEASVEESVEASVEESVEGSVLGGTGTPAPSTPDTALGASNGPSPLPTIIFAGILVASLAGLAWVNIQAVRSRS